MTTNSAAPAPDAQRTALSIILCVSGAHLLNDLLQFLLPALYPLLKENYGLSYFQIGMLTLGQQITACLLQPVFGLSGDLKPKPYWLALSMTIVTAGTALLAAASGFWMLFLAAVVVGTGSALFHPEASRVSRLASGGRLGFAQSLFQVGGNAGTALGPLAAALILLPMGQTSIFWFLIVAAFGIAVLSYVGRWYAEHQRQAASRPRPAVTKPALSRDRLIVAFAVIGALLLSKFIYIEGLKSYYAFFLMDKFALSAQEAQYYLFAFLGAVAAGTFIGGPVGDRYGRLAVIWVSILGSLPFTLALPYLDLFWTCVMSIMVGLILSSAFSAMVVYAQELVPGKVGMIAGFVFGFAFGIGALGAAIMGGLADWIGIIPVFQICAFLPALGILTILLPKTAELHPERKPA
ncbi:MFS transporter, FSR family, fosmidomycin resistance protein [Devosia lucknowensis]|uniref:MFS transporter, FSR family, fosmidomycin resistance protein n=1 Tax=Devosia lucknowensis TaxID=1096929 RepID=A0A1Y6EM39_9HYPH|nr:MFS transporter [Devosia lucknowensis]SMQ63637.1 MFS transporter, FSR family, fosmidomycin resistance protein [Devosia lucknowensis]